MPPAFLFLLNYDFFPKWRLKNPCFFLRFLQTAAGAFDRCDVDAADHDFDFLFHRNLLEDFLICDQSHDLGPTLALTTGTLDRRRYQGVWLITTAGNPDSLIFIRFLSIISILAV